MPHCAQARSQFWASSSSIILLFLFWSRVSHWIGSSLMRQELVLKLKWFICLCLARTRMHQHIHLSHRHWDLNLGPHACAASTFSIEVTSQPTLWVLITSLGVSWASPLPLTQGVFQYGGNSYMTVTRSPCTLGSSSPSWGQTVDSGVMLKMHCLGRSQSKESKKLKPVPMSKYLLNIILSWVSQWELVFTEDRSRN